MVMKIGLRSHTNYREVFDEIFGLAEERFELCQCIDFPVINVENILIKSWSQLTYLLLGVAGVKVLILKEIWCLKVVV